MDRLTCNVLGALQVSVDGELVVAFRSAKTRALLVYLLMESNRPHTRDALAALLWPDQSNKAARDNLRQALAVLRKALGDTDRESAVLQATRETIQFNPASTHCVDVLEFTHLIDTCSAHRHRHSETCRVCAATRRRAVGLYRGDFLDQFFLSDSAPFEEWALLKRERLRDQALDALCQLAEFHIRQGDYNQALAFALRQLELDPWREEAHRQAMRSLALDARLSAALDQFECCRSRLAEEMGVEPAQETVELYKTIKTQAESAAQETLPALLLRPAPSNLPSPVTPLLGRETELAELDRLLSDPDCRIVSIVGPGGVGKTRLAIAAASAQLTDFRDGVFFVSLASVDSARLIAPTVLSTLGAPSSSQKDAEQQLISYLHGHEVLLVLDNFEHLLEGTLLLATLLRRAPRVTILVTSRERLNLQGEWVLDLHGLEIPEGERVEAVDRYAAVQLFLQSAKRSRRAVSFSDEDKSIIVRICHLVEGMPLALELAAAWVRTLSCREIADEIETSYGFLTTGLRDVPPRHRSMRAVFEHSWNLLDEEERCALRRFAVFQGGFDREAAEQVAGATLALLAALVDKSLVRSTTSERYDLHNLIRQFALEQLDAARESQDVRQKHAEYYLGMAEATVRGLDSPDQVKSLQRLELENANLREALAWSVQDAGRAEVALRLCGALARSWDMRGYASEGRRWLDLAFQLVEQSDARAHAGGAAGPEASLISVPVLTKAYTAAGSLAFFQGDHYVARTYYQKALQLCLATDNRGGQATCYVNLGNAATHLGEYAEARALHEQSLALFRELGNKAGVARVLLNMGVSAEYQGDYAAALSLYEESLALRRELGDQFGTALVLGNMAAINNVMGERDRGRALVEASLSVRRSLGDRFGIANCLMELAILAHGDKDDAAARELYREALVMLEKTGSMESIARCLELLAEVDVDMGQVESGIQLWGAAEAIREALGTPPPAATRTHFEETWARVRSSCGVDAFERAWQQGRAMTTAEIVASALESE